MHVEKRICRYAAIETGDLTETVRSAFQKLLSSSFVMYGQRDIYVTQGYT